MSVAPGAERGLAQEGVEGSVTTSRERRGVPRAPFFAPALGVVVGIAAADSLGPFSAPERVVLYLLPVNLGLLLVLRPWAWTRASWGTAWLAAAVGMGVGAARYAATTVQRPDHIQTLLAADVWDHPEAPRLVCCTGRIVNEPDFRPIVLHNPHLPLPPGERTRFILSLESLGEGSRQRAASGHVRVSVGARLGGLCAGQRVRVLGRLYELRGARNPGETDWSRWNRIQGVDAGLFAANGGCVGVLDTGGAGWARFRERLRTLSGALLFEAYADYPTEESQRLLETMVLGQRSEAGRTLNEAFLRCGGMHFLAVSGFHVGVIVLAVGWVVRWLSGGSRRMAAVGSLAALAFYACVVEWHAPFLRAATLVILASVALLLDREVHVLNWLSLAAIVLLVQPMELFRAGFQLSFMQVLALLTLVPLVDRRLCRLVFARKDEGELDGRFVELAPLGGEANERRVLGFRHSELATLGAITGRGVLRWMVGLLAVCTVAWFTALPLVMYHFGRVAPWGIIGTFLLSPLVLSVIVVSFFTLLSGAALPPLGGVLAGILAALTDLLLRAVHLFDDLPGNVLEVARPPAWLVVASYVPLFALAALRSRGRFGSPRAPAGERDREGDRSVWQVARRGRRVVVGGLASVLLLWGGWFFGPWLARGSSVSWMFLDVGSGNGAVCRLPDGRATIVDLGTNRNRDVGEVATRALLTAGIRRLDHVLLSHGNFDHFSGVATLLERFVPDRVYVNDYFGRDEGSGDLGARRLLDLIEGRGVSIERVRQGRVLGWGGAEIEVLWPPADLDATWEANDRSLVVRFRHFGRSVLLTGDLEVAGMRRLLSAEAAGVLDLRADVLLAPHHGAVRDHDTEAFLRAVRPVVIVVSTGWARVGFEPLVRRVLGADCVVLSTRDCGALVVHIAGSGELSVVGPFCSDKKMALRLR